jgi:phage FluMu gp28-like protein
MKFPIVKFIEDNFKIWNKSVKLYPYQKKFLLDKSPRRIVLKARQTGFSTIIAMEALLKAINPDKTILITSVSDRQALEVMKKVSYFLRQVQDMDIYAGDMLISPFEVKRETKTEKIFETGTRIISLPNSPVTACGYTANFAYIDEFAKFEGDQEMLNAIEPSLARGGKLTLISTPYGRRGRFYEIWSAESDWSKHEIKWDMCPDEKYKKEVLKFKKKWGAVNFAQEFELLFTSEGFGFFPPLIVNPCIHKELSPELDNEKNYVQFGMDIGKIKTNTALVIVEKADYFDKEDKKLKSKIMTRKIKLWRLGTEYDIIKSDLKRYMNIYGPSRVNIDATGVGERLVEEIRREQGAVIIPIKFSSSMKERMFSQLRTLFENQRICIPNNSVLLNQLYEFERTITELGNVRYKGKRDDIVMALALSTLDLTRPRPFMGVR